MRSARTVKYLVGLLASSLLLLYIMKLPISLTNKNQLKNLDSVGTTTEMMMDVTDVIDEDLDRNITEHDIEIEMKEFLQENKKRKDKIKLECQSFKKVTRCKWIQEDYLKNHIIEKT